MCFVPDLHIVTRAEDHVACTIPDNIADDAGVALGRQQRSVQIIAVQIKDAELLLHASCDNAAAVSRKVASANNVLVRERVQDVASVCVPDLTIFF